MKFLCDNCKAKYQIADEKVAGKTVRMKCRKCGHQIEVRSAVTETSNSNSLPPPAPLPGVKAPPAKPGLATPLSAAKPRPSTGGMPAQSALAGAFTKNVEEAPASTSRDASIELSVTDEWYVAINGVPVGPVRISELRRKAATGAVNEESLCWQEGLEEWRPIRSIPELAQLVREAMASGARSSFASVGAMEAASPVAPSVKSTPPAAPKGPLPRQSSIPPAPQATFGAGTAAMVAPVAPRPTTTAAPQRSNVVPLRPAAVTGPSFDDMPMSPIGGGPGGSAAAFAQSPFTPPAPQTSPLPMSSPMQPVAPPVTSPSPGIDPFRAPSGPMPAAQPFSMTPAPAPMSLTPSYPDVMTGPQRPSFHPPNPSFSALPAPAPMPPPSVVAAPPEKKGGVPLWFWPILVLFLGFGGGLAFLVYKQQTPAPVVIQMPATAPPPATTSAPAVNSSDIPPPDTSADVVADNTPTPAGGKKPKGKATGGGNTTAAAQPQGGGLDLGNLGGGGVGGPTPGPNPNGGGGGGGGLDQAGVERVVSAHRAGVKRTCWERGGADQKSSVNVTVTANVAPNGTVSSTSSNGDDPVVGKCIENQVKIWSFPAPGSATTINIPFKFVRQ